MRKLLFVFTFLPIFIFGQEIISEEIDLQNGEILLPGTLSYPKSKGEIPLVIFVHGSGNVDRNGNQAPVIKANYIAQLADSLNKVGIAFYRYDKRTAIKENLSKLSNIRFEDFVADVKIAITNFSTDSRFNSINLIGHSQGSLVAMLSANKAVKSYISLAGPADPIAKTLVTQISAQNLELGEIAKAHLNELQETDTILKVNPFLIQLFAPQNQKFIKSWMAYNPTEEIKKLKKPILIVQGELDSQVTAEDARSLLSAASAVNSELGISISFGLIEDMNHVLKTLENQSDNLKSYSTADFPLSMKLVQSISNFILSNE